MSCHSCKDRISFITLPPKQFPKIIYSSLCFLSFLAYIIFAWGDFFSFQWGFVFFHKFKAYLYFPFGIIAKVNTHDWSPVATSRLRMRLPHFIFVSFYVGFQRHEWIYVITEQLSNLPCTLILNYLQNSKTYLKTGWVNAH